MASLCSRPHGRPGTTLPAPPEPNDPATHIRWGLQASVDDVVSENVPGPQGAHTTFDVAVPSRKNWNPSPTQILSRTTGPWHKSPGGSLRGLRTSVFTSIPYNTQVCVHVPTGPRLTVNPNLVTSWSPGSCGFIFRGTTRFSSNPGLQLTHLWIPRA